MHPKRLPNGDLQVPVKVDAGPGNHAVGMKVVKKGTAEHKRWLPHVETTRAPKRKG